MRARARAQVAVLGVLAVAVICAALLLRFPVEPRAEPAGASAGTAAQERLLLLSDNALHWHGRSGRGMVTIDAPQLGLRTLAPPLWVEADGAVLVNGRADEDDPLSLWRCDVTASACSPALQVPTAAPVLALAGSAIGDTLIALDGNGSLLRVSRDGAVEARGAVTPPPGHPRLLNDGGLLHIPAAEGPLLGVYRPDVQDFAQQLDALLLLPRKDIGIEVERIRDVVRAGAGYWALLADAQGATALYRFDAQWSPLGVVPLEEEFSAAYLIAWRDKVLVVDPAQRELLRFASDGRREAPLVSTLLNARWQEWQETSGLRRSGRAALVSVSLLLSLLLLGYAALQWLYYTQLPRKQQLGTAVLDPLPASVRWVPEAPDRDGQLRRLTVLILLAPLAAVPLMAGTGAGGVTLALVPAIVASLVAIRLLWVGAGGYCGLLPERLILVDYAGRYSFGRRGALSGNRHALLLGNVALPLGFPWLRNLRGEALTADGGPLHIPDPASTAAICARLLQRGHPWMLAALCLIAGWGLSAALAAALLFLH